MTLAALVVPSDLEHYKGAPFDEKLIEDAVAQVRGELGWHLAPVIDDEVVCSGGGGVRLVLPSLRVIDVHEVVEVKTDRLDRPLTGWRRGALGMLVRETGWPRGEDNLVVRLRHGFEACPADLRPVIVERIRALRDTRAPGMRSRTVGETATTWDAAPPAWSLAASSILDRYRV